MEVPSVAIAAMQTARINASMTAYSTAVGPLSSARNAVILDRYRLHMILFCRHLIVHVGQDAGLPRQQLAVRKRKFWKVPPWPLCRKLNAHASFDRPVLGVSSIVSIITSVTLSISCWSFQPKHEALSSANEALAGRKMEQDCSIQKCLAIGHTVRKYCFR